MNQSTLISDNIISWKLGKQWFDQGVNQFKSLKNHWYMACLVFAVILVVVTQIAPSLMPLLVMFLSPIMTALMMGLCQQLSESQDIQLPQIIRSIQLRLGDFLFLGVVSVLLSLLFQQIHLQLLASLGLALELTQDMVENMSGKEVFVRALLNLMTNIPIAMALAFSPALILFRNIKPLQAIKHSITGVIKGWRGFFVLMLLFMLVFMALVLLATLILTIVMAIAGASSQALASVIVFFFVLTIAGIGICAQYQAYKDIFLQQNSDKKGDDGAEIYTEI